MSNSTSSTGNRFITDSPDNHSGDIWVSTLVCLCFSTSALIAKWMSKRHMKTRIGWDDGTISASYVLAVIQHILVIFALTKNLGKSTSKMTPSDIYVTPKVFRASQVILICSLYFTKCSMVLLLERLFKRRLLYTAIGYIVAAVAAIFAVNINCAPESLFKPHTFSSCPNHLARWTYATGVDGITECIILVLLVWYLRDIQMDRPTKFKVVLSFCSRSSVILLSSLFLYTYFRISDDTPNKAATLALPISLQQWELCLSISTAAIIPSARFLFQSSEKALQAPSTPSKLKSSGTQGSIGLTRLKTDNQGNIEVTKEFTVTATTTPKGRSSPEGDADGEGNRLSASSLVPSLRTGNSRSSLVQDRSWNFGFGSGNGV